MFAIYEFYLWGLGVFLVIDSLHKHQIYLSISILGYLIYKLILKEET